MPYHTRTATLADYRKGAAELFGDDPKRYAFSNVYEVGNRAAPFERVAVTKSMEYVTEVMKVAGIGPWFAAAHDEFALVMDGEIKVVFVQLDAAARPAPDHLGAVHLRTDPAGPRMGMVRARRGHLVLLPAGAAYRISADPVALVLLQTTAGELTRERWSEICQTA
ncbi:hypothetical protein DFR70_107154 [Nocardia tenerifensis]|uniref:Hydroxyquinol 1,2-dioxygenase n=1 Tax=Nocardia tenerifensis TaxID=228006 RepID=A0A318JXH1_9NOCA|nr:hypothetical protein [Nocardia tenerifensis]PXX62287.1 hypothetical protein DFR70_107154 [Nocardia tenerifensis]